MNTWYTKSHTHPEQYFESSQWWTKNIRNTKGIELLKKEKSNHTEFKLILGYPSLKDTIRKTFILCKPMSILNKKDFFPPWSQSSFYLVLNTLLSHNWGQKNSKTSMDGELGGLQSMTPQSVRQYWVTEQERINKAIHCNGK